MHTYFESTSVTEGAVSDTALSNAANVPIKAMVMVSQSRFLILFFILNNYSRFYFNYIVHNYNIHSSFLYKIFPDKSADAMLFSISKIVVTDC